MASGFGDLTGSTKKIVASCAWDIESARKVRLLMEMHQIRRTGERRIMMTPSDVLDSSDPCM
jgi:hypothetical protein